VLLLDEPFSAVDAQTRITLQQELAQTLKRAGKTALLITHDLLEAVTLSDRVLVMSRRPGRLKADIRVPFPRPRAVYELKADREFGRLGREIWMQLREEVVLK
jgi:NitT/TauT family transport system ATP-binding protein